MRPFALALFALPALLGACRGQPSEKPPFHLVPDMDWQPKYRPEQESHFFADHRTMRPLIEGTVAQGHLDEDDDYYRGKVGESFVAVVPRPVDAKTLERGQDRFNVFCSPCHDMTGHGKGLAVQHGFPPPIDLSSDRVRGISDGEIFNVITHGVRNMPSYANQIPVEDRWSIVTWVRVLQRSQHASLDDVPTQLRDKIEPEGATP